MDDELTKAAQENEDLWKFLLEVEDPVSARQKLFDDLSSQAEIDEIIDLDLVSSNDFLDKFAVPNCSISSSEEERVDDWSTDNISTERMEVLMDRMQNISILPQDEAREGCKDFNATLEPNDIPEDHEQKPDEDLGFDVEMVDTGNNAEEMKNLERIAAILNSVGVAGTSGLDEDAEVVASTSRGTSFDPRTFFESAEFDLKMLDELATEREQWLSSNNKLQKKFPLSVRNEPNQIGTSDSRLEQHSGADAPTAQSQGEQLMMGLEGNKGNEEASSSHDLPRRQNLMASKGLCMLDELCAKQANENTSASASNMAVRCDIPDFMSKLEKKKKKKKSPVNTNLELFDYQESSSGEDSRSISELMWSPDELDSNSDSGDSGTSHKSILITGQTVEAFLEAYQKAEEKKLNDSKRLIDGEEKIPDESNSDVSPTDDDDRYWHVTDDELDELFPLN